MGSDTTVRVQGLDALVRSLNRAQIDLGDLKDANNAAGRMVASAAQGLAPKLSGRLASTIRANRAARRAEVLAGKKAVPYAGPIHWGWPSRGIAARPFLSIAAQQTESAWVPRYLEDVQRTVDKVKGA